MPINPSCLTCNKVFSTVTGMQSHCRAKGHRRNKFVCIPCDTAFVNLHALEMHLNSPRHAYDDFDDYSANPYIRHFCSVCYKEFNTAKSLQQHTDSGTHGYRSYDCPFCSSVFKSPSAVAHHLESGCHSRISRHQVTSAVKVMNIIPSIYAKPLALEAPVVVSPVEETTTYLFALPSSFNGKAYQCHICYKTFRSLYSLTGHLNSAAHDDQEFMCPNRKCKKRFTLISGFIQHLESRACGLSGPKQIGGFFENLTGQFKRSLTL